MNRTQELSLAQDAVCTALDGPYAYMPGLRIAVGCPSYVTCSSPDMRIMRSGDVCQCAGTLDPAGTLKKTSAFGFAGSP